MALSASAKAVNTAVVALAALLETHIETLTNPMTRDEELIFVFVSEASMDAHTEGKSNWALDADMLPPSTNRTHQTFRVPGTHETADQARIPIRAGGKPLFWFISNAAGDLDVT